MTFDQNGNLTSDGTNTYTWNTRDELIAMSGPSLTASFIYDGEGRRISKTVNGITTNYVYDGLQVVEEQQQSGPVTTQLAGGLDEVFFRKSGANTEFLLTDALGSTWGLADNSGNVNTEYKYDVFGQTQQTGQASNNPLQYTGRENDGTGLYYYRNRYYSPNLRRFISRDPLGEAAGENEYSYVGNNPISYTDPLGLFPDDWYRITAPLDLGGGWRGRVDTFNTGQGFEIHVYRPDRTEAGIVSGRDGWIGKHGHNAVRPPSIPDSVVNKINGENVSQLRNRGIIPPKGTPGVDIRRGAYLSPGRTLFSKVGGATSILNQGRGVIHDYERWTRAMRKKKTFDDQMCDDFNDAGPYIDSIIGPLPNPYQGRVCGII